MVFVLAAVVVAIVLIKLHLVWPLILLGAGLAAGLRWGTGWAFWRLGEFERRQRHYRARNWRRGS